MSKLTDKQRRLLRKQFDRNAVAARSSGKPSSEYFLEKCDSEICGKPGTPDNNDDDDEKRKKPAEAGSS